MFYKYFITILFLILSFNINSEESKEDEKKEILIEETITFEESMEDLTNRFILATFGKDGLNWFEASEIKDINTVEINDNQLEPFKNLNYFISPVFTFLLNLTISMFIIYLSWVSYQGLFKSQNSGDFLGRSWNKTFFIIKISIVSALIAPIPTIEGIPKDKNDEGLQEVLNKVSIVETDNSKTFSNFNLIQGLTLKIAGTSNELGKGINRIITENQPSAYPSYRIPDSDVKIKPMKNLVDFFICLKNTENDKEDLYINFTKNDTVYESSFSNRDCSFNIKFSIDNITPEIVEKYPEIQAVVGDYKKLQEDIYIKTIEELFVYADIVSDNILTREPYSGEIPSDARNDFKKYTKNSEEINNDLSIHWELTCEDFLSNKLFESRTNLTKIEREIYSYMSYRCMSFHLQKATIFDQIQKYPSTKEVYFKSNNYLRDNNIELCSHDFNSSEQKINKVSYIESTESLKEKILETNNKLSDQYLSLDNCIKRECSLITTESPNLYMCSNAINLYDKVEKDKKIDKYGFFSIGASIYNKFKGFSSDNTKTFFNSFNININATDKTTPETDIKFKILDKNINRNSFSNSMIEEISIYNLQELNNKHFELQKQDNEIPSIGSLTNYIFDNDFMGANRLRNCISNPLIISDGYSCGSVTEEYHNFGANLFTASVNMKIMVTLIDTFRFRLKDGVKLKRTLAPKPQNSVSSVKDNMAFKMLSVALPIITSKSMYTTIEKMQDNLMYTDEFGNMTSKKVNFFTENKYLMAMLAGLTTLGGDGVFNFIDSFLNILIFISIFFKYIIPIIPYYFYLVLVFGWTLLLFELLIIMPIWAIYIIKPSQNHTSEILKRGLNMFLSMLLKIPLLILGTVIAWIMTNTVATRLIHLYDFNTVMDISYGQSFTGILDATVNVVIYLIILFVLTNMTLSTMNNFYEFCTNWMSGKIDNVRIGKDNTSEIANQSTSVAKSAGIRGFL